MNSQTEIVVVYEEKNDPELGDLMEPVPATADHDAFDEVELAFFDSYDPEADAPDDFSDLFEDDPNKPSAAATGRGWLRRFVAGLDLSA